MSEGDSPRENSERRERGNGGEGTKSGGEWNNGRGERRKRVKEGVREENLGKGYGGMGKIMERSDEERAVRGKAARHKQGGASQDKDRAGRELRGKVERMRADHGFNIENTKADSIENTKFCFTFHIQQAHPWRRQPHAQQIRFLQLSQFLQLTFHHLCRLSGKLFHHY